MTSNAAMCQRSAVGVPNGLVDSPKPWFDMPAPPPATSGYRRDRYGLDWLQPSILIKIYPNAKELLHCCAVTVIHKAQIAQPMMKMTSTMKALEMNHHAIIWHQICRRNDALASTSCWRSSILNGGHGMARTKRPTQHHHHTPQQQRTMDEQSYGKDEMAIISKLLIKSMEFGLWDIHCLYQIGLRTKKLTRVSFISTQFGNMRI